MTEASEVARRLGVAHGWAAQRARRSERPSVFLDRYEEAIHRFRTDSEVLERRSDYFGDSITLAAEIEAFAAWRRVQEWYTGKGLLKSRRHQESQYRL